MIWLNERKLWIMDIKNIFTNYLFPNKTRKFQINYSEFPRSIFFYFFSFLIKYYKKDKKNMILKPFIVLNYSQNIFCLYWNYTRSMIQFLSDVWKWFYVFFFYFPISCQPVIWNRTEDKTTVKYVKFSNPTRFDSPRNS